MRNQDERIQELAIQVSKSRGALATLTGDVSTGRSRIDAAENVILAHAATLAELRETLETHRHRIAHNAQHCHKRHIAVNDALGAIQTQFTAVLESHTAAIFRLEQRIDLLAEHTQLKERRDAGTAPIIDDQQPHPPTPNSTPNRPGQPSRMSPTQMASTPKLS